MTIRSVLNPSVVGDNIIEISPPRARCDANGKLLLDENDLPQFDHDTPGDFWTERNVPIKPRFFDRYLQSTPQAFIAVFIALANTCDYSQIRMRVNEAHQLVTNGSGDAVAEMTRHGNRTKTRSYQQLAREALVHADTVRKAIKFWIAQGAMKEIDIHRPTARKLNKSIGRPIKTVRFELNPEYVWCGSLVDGVCYAISRKFHSSH